MHQADAYDPYSHGVVFTEGGQFARWLDRRRGGGVHPPPVRPCPGSDLVVEATAPDDGMIEAIRHTGHLLRSGCSGTPSSTPPARHARFDCAPLPRCLPPGGAQRALGGLGGQGSPRVAELEEGRRHRQRQVSGDLDAHALKRSASG